MTNQKLIKEIMIYIKNTHNEQDFEDLKTFTTNELKDILEECKELAN